MIHIGLCADEKFSIALGVCMTSIFESNKGSDVMVHILTKAFLEKTIEKINRTMEIYHQEVKIYQIDDIKISRKKISGQLFRSRKTAEPLPEYQPWEEQSYNAICRDNFQKL